MESFNRGCAALTKKSYENKKKEATQKAVKVPGEDLANPLEAHATRAAFRQQVPP